MYFKRDKQSMTAKRPARQRRDGSKVSLKRKRQLCPESSGRTSCLVMSAVPPELPERSGRSRAQTKRCPHNAGPAAHLLAAGVPRRGSDCSFRVFVHAASAHGFQQVPCSLGRPGCATFPDHRFSVILKITPDGGFVNPYFRLRHGAAPPPAPGRPADRRQGPR